MREQEYFASRIKSSPTGRVPKWVIDEAMGRPVDVVPFRGGAPGIGNPSPPLPSRRSRSRPLVAALIAGLSVLVVAAARTPFGPATHVAAISAGSQSDSAPPAGHEERSHRLVPPTGVETSGATGGYRFLRRQPGSAAPITWSPCRPIHYVVRPDNQPAGGPAIIAGAIDAAAAATGLAFVNDGATSEPVADDRAAYQPSRYGKRWAPVLIAWATPDEVPDFGVDVAGEAGPVGITTASGDATYVSGTVFLDAAKLGAVSATQGPAVAQQIVMHELGHLLGLAHVNDRAQVMFPRASTSVLTYGGGDLAGLARLGSGPCQPDA